VKYEFKLTVTPDTSEELWNDCWHLPAKVAAHVKAIIEDSFSDCSNVKVRLSGVVIEPWDAANLEVMEEEETKDE